MGDMYFIRLLCTTFIFGLVVSVDRSKFKTCDQSGFCRRNRGFHPSESEFVLLMESLTVEKESVHGSLINTKTNVRYSLLFEALVDNTFRLRINEEEARRQRFQAVHALISEPALHHFSVLHQSNERLTLQTDDVMVDIEAAPFKIKLYYDEELVAVFNADGRLRFEHYREKPQPAEKQEGEQNNVDNGEGEWEEHFKEHADSKPFGPMSVAADFKFSAASHLYGLPEHADGLALQPTSGGNPYRLYNLDVFEYEVNEKMALYGSVPFVLAHGLNVTVGVFWLNSAETWVDIFAGKEESSTVMASIVNFVSGGKEEKTDVEAHFMSETGILDVFFMIGPSFYDVTRQFSRLTGSAPLPQQFTLGYHQSRWNYNDQKDVHDVSTMFDEHNIPVDVLWLDIEHTNGKRYFTWDPVKFPKPEEMIRNLTEKGRKLVTIVDPHIKRANDYFIHNDATAKGYYVKNKDGNDFEGWCWPGSSSYLDFLNPDAAEYYMSRFFFENFEGSTEDHYIWNDMNEPSVFNGPEVTMPKDCVHHGGWEHREIHNIYGLLQVHWTYQGLLRRTEGRKRPFILTRAFFAGTQRYAAIWTGDNMAEWSHLKVSIPMCLSAAIGGISFCGADVGGFFKNPDTQLLVRWYQGGSYLPFFRAHSHIDTNRREPWLFDDNTLELIRNAVIDRYSLLPYWYSSFYEHERTGVPVIRPLFAEFMTEKETFEIDDEFLVGDSILVRPVTEPGVSHVNVYFPGKDEIWYDKDTYEQIRHNGVLSVSVDLSKVPVYYRGGSIIPKRNRPRRSSACMVNDPYTLTVLLSTNGTAAGHLFIDDGESFEYRRKNYAHMEFTFKNNQLISRFLDDGRFVTDSWIERVDIIGIPNLFRSAILRPHKEHEAELEVKYNVPKQMLRIRKPGVNAASQWTITLN